MQHWACWYSTLMDVLVCWHHSPHSVSWGTAQSSRWPSSPPPAADVAASPLLSTPTPCYHGDVDLPQHVPKVEGWRGCRFPVSCTVDTFILTVQYNIIKIDNSSVWWDNHTLSGYRTYSSVWDICLKLRGYRTLLLGVGHLSQAQRLLYLLLGVGHLFQAYPAPGWGLYHAQWTSLSLGVR